MLQSLHTGDLENLTNVNASENCAILTQSDVWDDHKCYEVNRFICESEMR